MADEVKEINDNTTPEEVDIEDLLLADMLRPFSKTIGKHFEGRKAIVYRCVPNPATKESMYPKKLRKFESLAEAIKKYEYLSPDSLDEEEQLKLVNHHFGTSVFTNEEGLKVMWDKGYSTKAKTSDKKRYIKDMGDSIVRLIIEGKSSGVLEKNIRESDGHHNFLQSRNFVLEEHIDREYGINGYKTLLISNDEKGK